MAELRVEMERAKKEGFEATGLAIMGESGDAGHGAQCYMVAYKEQCQQAIGTWVGNAKVAYWCSLDEEAEMPGMPPKRELPQDEGQVQQAQRRKLQGRVQRGCQRMWKVWHQEGQGMEQRSRDQGLQREQVVVEGATMSWTPPPQSL